MRNYKKLMIAGLVLAAVAGGSAPAYAAGAESQGHITTVMLVARSGTSTPGGVGQPRARAVDAKWYQTPAQSTYARQASLLRSPTGPAVPRSAAEHG